MGSYRWRHQYWSTRKKLYIDPFYPITGCCLEDNCSLFLFKYCIWSYKAKCNVYRWVSKHTNCILFKNKFPACETASFSEAWVLDLLRVWNNACIAITPISTLIWIESVCYDPNRFVWKSFVLDGNMWNFIVECKHILIIKYKCYS